MKKLLVAIFFAALIVYFLTSGGDTPYNYFTRLADAFLRGRYWITENPPWLSELVPWGDNKFYVIQPPMPAILALPFVFFFGANFPQQILAHLLGAGLVTATVGLVFATTKNRLLAIWAGILIGFGSIVWYLAATGSVWYLGQVSSAFFLTLALWESFTKKRPWLIGAFLGAAYLSRVHVILSGLLFVYIMFDNKLPLPAELIKKWKRLALFAIGLTPFFLFNFLYNYLRFGVLWDKGYFLVPGILSEPWFAKGMLSPVYMLDHLKILFLELPKVLNHAPFIQPSWLGLAIWITTPAFIFALFAPLKNNLNKMYWLTIFLIFTILGLRGGTGWSQFGYRYAVDFYPFLLLLTVNGIKPGVHKSLKWYHWLLLGIGVIVNLWGVVWINKFGWVSF